MALRSEFLAFRRITTATTTQVKNGPTLLKRVVINVPVAAATISLYDAQSATTTPIGVITSTTDLKPYFIDFDVRLINGLNVVTTGAQDITVVFE